MERCRVAVGGVGERGGVVGGRAERIRMKRMEASAPPNNRRTRK
jgi:hypothetical protein